MPETSYELEIRNIQLGASLNEKSISLGDAKRVQIGCRDADDQPASFRLSNAAGGTFAGPYINLIAGGLFVEVDIRSSQKLYLASTTANAVIEVLIWR